ncbi:MAG: 4Fe-4S cluster-binding domain-containing protein [Proteobacteria bacterium]|nr:4Fe-4S cluster-binding domain-containing protein [Pseudomonadota bacterium]
MISEEFLAEASDRDFDNLSSSAQDFRFRYSVKSKDQEREMEELLFKRYLASRSSSSKPYFLIIPTYNCNTACAYCWQTELHDQKTVMSEKIIDRSFEAMDKLMSRFDYKHERPTVEIFGGEPLQDHSIQAVYRILEKVEVRDLDSVITTNGSLLHKYCDTLIKFQNLQGIHVTVDGPKDVHNRSRPMKNGGDGFSNIIGFSPHLSTSGSITVSSFVLLLGYRFDIRALLRY